MELTALPRPLAVFNGPTSKEREGKGREEKERGTGRNRRGEKRGEEGKGRGFASWLLAGDGHPCI